MKGLLPRTAAHLEVIHTPEPEAVAQQVIESVIAASVAKRGRAALCLAGGSTPLPLYHALASNRRLPWEQVVFALGDERFVAPDHPDSNFGSIKAALLDQVAAREAVLAWPILESPHESAAAYGRVLRQRLGSEPVMFDLTLLGIGGDGHTASLFPGTGAAASRRTALACDVPEHGWRLSLGVAALSASRVVMFLVTGAAKADALRLTFPATFGTSSDAAYGAPAADHAPASAITAVDRLLLVTDSLPPLATPR